MDVGATHPMEPRCGPAPGARPGDEDRDSPHQVTNMEFLDQERSWGRDRWGMVV